MNIKFKRLTPFKRCVLQNFPFIEADFDALTNYGLLCKVVEYLNKVIKSQDELQVVTEQMVTAFNNLYDYVNNYFDNLDVQEEINNKLDQMVEDGSLEDIIAPYINRYMSIPDKYHFDTLFAPTSYGGGCQGGCVLPDGNIIQFDGQGSVKKYAQDGTLLGSNSAPYGHCNGACYCSKTDTVFVEEHENTGATVTKCVIHEIDPVTLELVESHEIDNDAFPSYPYGLVYDDESDTFTFVNWWSIQHKSYYANYSWKTDSEFNLIDSSVKEHNFDIDSASYFGKLGDYYAVEEITTHDVLLFDKDMNYVKSSKLNELVGDTWINTETEWFDTRNSKVYIGFVAGYCGEPHWGGTYIYGKCDLSNNYPVTVKRSYDTISPHKEIYFVDHTTTDLTRNGSSTKPFMNIYEAINSSLRKENVTGSVTIQVENSSESKYYPLFSMNKTYQITYVPNETITDFNAIGVDKGCTVIFNHGIELTPLETKLNPFKYGGVSDIQVLGSLYVAGNLSTDDNSDLLISGSDNAHIQFGFVNSLSYDVTNFWGTIQNINQTTFNKTDLIKGNTYYGTTRNRQIKGLMWTMPTAESYTLPHFSENMRATIQCKINSSNITLEPTINYWVGRFQSFPITDGTNWGLLKTETNGNLTVSSGVVVSRVIIES